MDGLGTLTEGLERTGSLLCKDTAFIILLFFPLPPWKDRPGAQQTRKLYFGFPVYGTLRYKFLFFINIPGNRND